MKARNLLGLLLSLTALVVAGCGGGGGGGSISGGNNSSNTTLSGTASKGPIRNGHLQAFQIFSSHNPAKTRISGSAFASATTDDLGNYSISIPAEIRRDGILIRMIDGVYLDEATQLDKHVETEYPGGMRAAFGNISGAVRRGDTLKMSVTPYTELAVRAAGTRLDDNSVRSGRDRIELAFDLRGKGIDIVNTQPLDPNIAFPAGSSSAQQNYALALATMSQFEKDFGGGTNLGAISDDLLSNHISADGVLDLETHHKMGTSSATYIDDKGGRTNPILNDPSLNSSAPAHISSDPSTPISVQINTNVPITADVTNSAGGPVPDGTTVNFAATIGTLSSASAKTVNGIATVTLTSATAGSGTVTMSAGTASDPTGTITFVNPDAPVALSLTANPPSGTTSTSSGPVVIKATVTRAAGGFVPDGTVVNFAVTSGVGTVSAATATTAAGIATVNLTSSAAGTALVTARAGTITNTISVLFNLQPTLAILKVATAGTLPSGVTIGGVQAIVTYPTAGLTIDVVHNPNDVVTSGAATSAFMFPNTNTGGEVNLGLISVTPAGIGIQAGEFATLTFHVAAGTFPQLSDFQIAAGASVLGAASNAAIPGMSVQVLSLALQ